MINGKIINNKSNFEIAGIYTIINLVNNKFYIGSAKDLWRRKRNHYNDLDKNKHVNQHLQNAYNKYGKNYFIMIMLEKVDNICDLLDREQFWIDELNACENGYNICPKAKSVEGRVFLSETRQKISKSLTGRKIPIEISDKAKRNRNYKTIYQYNIDGEFIKQWNSSLEIIDYYKSINDDINRHYLTGCCNARPLTYKGCIWSYVAMSKEQILDTRINKFDGKFQKNHQHSPEYIEVLRQKGYRHGIYQYDKCGNLIKIWDTTKEISDNLGHDFNATYIRNCCNGYQLTYKSFIWSYVELNKDKILEKFQ